MIDERTTLMKCLSRTTSLSVAKNGSFKVEETGLQKVNGSKNYLREGYVFDGILYQVFSGTLHLSSLKTEEIQEDGWF